MIFNNQIKKNLHLFFRKVFPPFKVINVLDRKLSNLHEIIDIYPSESIDDTNILAVPETIHYEFSAKKAYLFEDVIIWPQNSIVHLPGKALIINETAFNQSRLDKLLTSGSLPQFLKLKKL